MIEKYTTREIFLLPWRHGYFDRTRLQLASESRTDLWLYHHDVIANISRHMDDLVKKGPFRYYDAWNKDTSDMEWVRFNFSLLPLTHISIRVLPNTAERFVTLTHANHAGARLEPGNLRFDLLRDAQDPHKFFLYEVVSCMTWFCIWLRLLHAFSWHF
jgi:hypothetical protein